MTVKVNITQLDTISFYLNKLAQIHDVSREIENFAGYINGYIAVEREINAIPDEFNNEILIYFIDKEENSANCLDDIFGFMWGYPKYTHDETYMFQSDFENMLKIELNIPYNMNKSDMISDEDLVYKIEENTIPLKIAKEMYNSSSPDLKNYALSLYKEYELKALNLLEFKEFDACSQFAVENVLDDPLDDDDWIINFITTLNGKNFDYNGEVYLPIIKVIKDVEYFGEPKDTAGKFELHGIKYYIVPGNKSEFVPLNGYFNYDNANRFGCVSYQMSSFACATKQIAMFISKYYAKELFRCIMKYYENIKWFDV